MKKFTFSHNLKIDISFYLLDRNQGGRPVVQFDDRNITLLDSLVVANVYLAPEKLQEELGISKRTLQYDVEKINKELDTIGLDGIQSVRAQGYYLLEDEKVTINNCLKIGRQGIKSLQQVNAGFVFYFSCS